MKDHRSWYLIPLMTLGIAAPTFASSPPNVIMNTSEPVKFPFEEFYFEKQTLISWIKNKIGGQELNPTVREKR